jgi:class 3 adenylate cyclase
LFPEVVRDRLFGTESKGSKGGSVSNDPTRPVENLETDKLRLKNYINTGGATGANGVQSKPIADLFTHCTVMFGDIAGFTAWSSMREPVQVFTLLESLYAAFDKIATKRRVFKVETIGDCYMAVTGLPDPQADHAILMARFARDILRRTQQLTRKLEYRLG